MISFIGAGPGDPELLTIKGKKLIDAADVIIYAGSLVNPEVLSGRKPDAEVFNSAYMDLDEVIAVMEKAEKEGKKCVRVHTGDPAIYGAHREQMDRLDDALKYQDNIVVMKAFKSMDRIISLMESNNVPLDRATVISNLGMEGEYIGPLDKGRDYGYFTTVLIKRCSRI